MPSARSTLSISDDSRGDESNSGVHRISVDRDQGHDRVVATGGLSVQTYLKCHFIVQSNDARNHDTTLVTNYNEPPPRPPPLQKTRRDEWIRPPRDPQGPG